MAEVILSMGSNMGNRTQNINLAIDALKKLPETKILKISKFYETEPAEVNEIQNKYINCCVKIGTDLSPHMLMGICLGIEAAIGRERPYEHSPRIIDIDILAYENEIISEKNLTLPHPRMKTRAFVLIPLKDICPNMEFKNINFKNNFENCEKYTVKSTH